MSCGPSTPGPRPRHQEERQGLQGKGDPPVTKAKDKSCISWLCSKGPNSPTQQRSACSSPGRHHWESLITSLLRPSRPSLCIPDEWLSAQLASALLALPLHLFIQQLQRPELRKSFQSILPRRMPRLRKVESRRRRNGTQMGTLMQQEPFTDSFPIRENGKWLKAQALELSRLGLESQFGHILAV